MVVDVISNSSIQVQWGPPARTNGILTHYTITVFNQETGFDFSSQINASDADVITVNGLSMLSIQTSPLVSFLHPCFTYLMFSGAFVPYTVQVFASTEAGEGSPVTSLIYTRHGGKALLQTHYSLPFGHNYDLVSSLCL